MPNLHVINITGIDSNNNLIVDKPYLSAKTRDTVQWVIDPNSGVDSILNIREKDGINDVWKTRPLKNNSWKGKIRRRVPSGYVYDYDIIWGKGSNCYVHDPKISINPTPAPLTDNVLFTVITVMGIASIVFLMRKNIWK